MKRSSAVRVAAGLLVAAAGSTSADRLDFRYAPPEWQAAICLPDDPQKTLVNKKGELFNDGPRVSVEVAGDAVWQRQELHSPRVPLVKTYRAAPSLEIVEEAFAVAGPARADVILVHVTNTGTEAREVCPHAVLDGKRSPLAPVTVAAGKSADWVVTRGGPALTLRQALAERKRAIAFWERKSGLPYGRIEVPDAGIQALVDSSLRNIWQAREIKNGLPVFQVGPTCYRGLWIVDGAFLLEAAAMLGAGDQARNGIATELRRQKDDGRIEVLSEDQRTPLGYWKESGIVLWTCFRHAQLTQDKAWLESVWPQLQRMAEFIRGLRSDVPAPCKNGIARIPPHNALDAGLIPAGIIDGGIHHGVEYSNTYWSLLGLRAFIEAAQWLGKPAEAVRWQKEYDDFLSVFRKAAARDMAKDPQGHAYLPTLMGAAGLKELPQRAQWAFCHAIYPGQIFSKDDPLVIGNLAMLAATEREGMVYGTGWDATGLWTYFASFYAHAWLWQGDGRKAAQILYAYGNHAAPVLAWREEQSLRGAKYKEVGDMPHNWASAEFLRLVVHLLALDRGNELHLFEGLPPEWTKPGMVTRLNGIATPFGQLTVELKIARNGQAARLRVEPLSDPSCRKIVVHLNGLTELDPRARTVRWIPLTRPESAAGASLQSTEKQQLD